MQLRFELAANEQSRTLSRIPLQALVRGYHILDTISLMKPDAINSRMDSICAGALTGSVEDSLTSIHTTTPRPWLAIRRMLGVVHTSVLHSVLSVLSEALCCTDLISRAKTSEMLELTADERKLVEAPFFDCVNARKLVMVLLRDDTLAIIDGSTVPKTEATLTTKPQAPNVTPHKVVDYIDSNRFSSEKRGLAGHLAARIARACTFFRLDIFGKLVQIKARRIR